MRIVLLLIVLVLYGCNKSGPHEIADGRGICVNVVDYDGHTGRYVVVSYVDGNGYMVFSGELFESDKCNKLSESSQ